MILLLKLYIETIDILDSIINWLEKEMVRLF